MMAPKSVKLKTDSRSKTKKQSDFLAKLAEYASLSRACRIAKVPRNMVYRWLQTDAGFKEKYTEACIAASQTLEDEAVRRAFEGFARPVFYQGKKIGTIKEFSDTLLMALLKARVPAKYRDKPPKADAGTDDTAAQPQKRTVIKWGDKEIAI